MRCDNRISWVAAREFAVDETHPLVARESGLDGSGRASSVRQRVAEYVLRMTFIDCFQERRLVP